VFGEPDVFMNTVGDIHLLPKVLEAAATFGKRPDDEIMNADLSRFGIEPLFTE
jgi:hypothetical protein